MGIQYVVVVVVYDLRYIGIQYVVVAVVVVSVCVFVCVCARTRVHA